MSAELYVGIEDKARKVSNIYVGVGGKARKVVKAYVGDSNKKARLCWELEIPDIPNNYLTFSSNGEFSISPKYYKSSSATTFTTKTWDGTMEYSLDGETWTIWKGESISAGEKEGKYYLYIRGYGNTYLMPTSGSFSTTEDRSAWYITTSGDNLVDCSGNLITLVDYKKIALGTEPELAEQFAKYLFCRQTSLRSAPDILISSIPYYGCYYTFAQCSSLEQSGTLSATKIGQSGYYNMFYNCSSLVEAPELPATELNSYCYNNMFYSCSSLVEAPELPATTLADYCYKGMFQKCASLTKAPELPATTMPQQCYSSMFYGCSSLVEAPEITITSAKDGAFAFMFQDCINLQIPPKFIGNKITVYNIFQSTFRGCSSLVSAPDLSAFSSIGECSYMFLNCSSLVNIPKLKITSATSEIRQIFSGCSSLKISETRSDEYPTPYKIPYPSTHYTTGFPDMFTGTSGTFTGTPTMGGTYYLHTSCDTVPSSKTEEVET